MVMTLKPENQFDNDVVITALKLQRGHLGDDLGRYKLELRGYEQKLRRVQELEAEIAEINAAIEERINTLRVKRKGLVPQS